MEERIRKTLLELKGTNFGTALKTYLEEKINELNNVSTIVGNAEEKGKIVGARIEAIRILKNCFWFLEEPKTEGKKGNQYL